MLGSKNTPDTEAVKVKGITLAITSSFSVREPIRIGDANGGRHMVSKALSNFEKPTTSQVME